MELPLRLVFLVSKIRNVSKKIALYSTRKTAPGLRIFDKEAVKIGGGHKQPYGPK